MNQIPETLIHELREQLVEDERRAVLELQRRDELIADARAAAEAAALRQRNAAGLRDLLAYADPDNADQYQRKEPGAERSAQRRTEYLDGLRAAVEFFYLHPEIPTPYSEQLNVFPGGDGAEAEIAEVARIASSLGLAAGRERPSGHFKAELSFSPSVSLVIVSTERTDRGWKSGDELPQWFLHEQDVYGAAQAPAVDERQEAAL